MSYINPFIAIHNWMVAADQRVSEFDPTQAGLYEDLVREEYKEWVDARADNGFNHKEDLDAICDLIWVSVAYAKSMGYDIEGAFAEIVRSNNSKIDPRTGKVEKNPKTGKVLKPEGYSPPDLTKFI